MKELILTFYTIDFWGRPVYKVKDMNLHIGSVDTIFPNKTIAPNSTTKEINAYFREHLDELTIFGVHLDDDPLGTNIRKDIKLIIKD